ncbi:PREDICTED: crossover junction endonuclease MUS81 [Bactrocera latifrons]|uniref:Crossover junction endonuclease MUS81 n=1 Tax=Bactrocera latifrons TaxID=174628 RepID=A0A0K8W571_BACLA|nr:PREDICTED: crossover junction endonuclease MUS81 [Bactrocera latifrons]
MAERLKITLAQPNPLFEKWLEKWLEDAERRNAKSQYKLREALIALRSYPLPLSSGRECAILRGFGSTLCNLIDDELRLYREKLQNSPLESAMKTFESDVKQLVESVKKTKRKKSPKKLQPKITKKEQKAIAEEEERQRQVIMSPGNFRIILLVDTQETSGKNKRTLDQTRSYLESFEVLYEVRRLTIGDFLWIARDQEGNELVLPYIVERKRFDDLASSIRDGRFHEQKHRLRQCGIQNIIYLVEDFGDNEHLGLPMESLQQAIVNTQIHSGFKIAHTQNNFRSMKHLQSVTNTLIRCFREKVLLSSTKEELRPCRASASMIGLLKFRALYEDSARGAQLTVREIFVQQLLQLHSLSMEKALAIVEVYPTPRLLFDAYKLCLDERDARLLLSKITCGPLQRPLGEKISQTVYDFYKTEF